MAPRHRPAPAARAAEPQHTPTFAERLHDAGQLIADEVKVVKQKTEELEHMVENEFRSAKKKIMMYVGSIEEAPLFMQFNKYIHGGYRIDAQHYSDVFLSLFSFHNETVNIWSHLLGLVFMIVSFFYTLATFHFTNSSDLLIFVLFFVGASAMFLLSTMYHLFNCTNDHKVFSNLLTCDYIGIFSMILGSAVSGFHFSFHCFWLERTVYQVAIAVICLAGMSMIILSKLGHDSSDLVRVLFYFFSVSFTALPVAHMAVFFGIYDTTRWWVLLGLYAAGLAVYITKFPECKFPGKFDFLFSSHQLWHFFILSAGIWHYYSIATLYHQRIEQGCSA